jgi:LuxR family transcriptional regulator of spore coat protein
MKRLSPRELSCLEWVAAGKTSWETSRILGISERTINFHVRNACGKLGVNRRAAAVAKAMRGGLLPNTRPPASPDAQNHELARPATT